MAKANPTAGRKRGQSSKSVNEPEVPVFGFDTHCARCKGALEDEQINCDSCSKWHHRKCTELSNADFDYMVRTDDSVGWFCPQCRNEKATMKGLENKIDVMLQMMHSLGERLVRAEAGEAPQLRQHIQNVVKEEVKLVMEKEEQDKRLLNLLVVNIPESQKEGIEEKRVQDVKRVNEVLKMTGLTNEEMGEVNNVFRLGREPRPNDRPRPIRVSVQKSVTKDKVLRNAREVNKNKAEGETLIYINRDLTKKEREFEKTLRDELREKRKGEGRWVIRNKTVVEKTDEGARAAPRIE